MYKTIALTVRELVFKMRHMEIGEEIGLSQTANGEYSYGIRRLPGGMFDNGMCWLADYYGGGSTMAFSETEDEFREAPSTLVERVWDWLDKCDLVHRDDGYTVYVQCKDGTLPETKWEFKTTEIQPKNRLVSVSFILSHAYETKISVPPKATDDEIINMTQSALIDCDKEKFWNSVTDVDAKHWDIWPEDFVDMVVNHDYKQTTDLPTGTLGR